MDQQVVQQEIGVAANKMTSEMLAPSIFKVYSTCMGEPGEWAQADPFTWDKIATKAIKLIDSNIRDQLSMSVKALAKTLCGWGHGVDFAGVEAAWDGATATEKSAWEAVGRHLVNCIDSEVNSVNVAELEERIIQWFNARMVSIN